MITAKVIEDSVAYGRRLITVALSYPRWIHSELMTYRVFSRCASSSRAIPIAKMIERATKQTAYPVYWGKNQKGMQAFEELSPKDQERARGVWLGAAEMAARYAQELADIGVHKQTANRLIENFQNIEVVVTSTKWANFFAQRNHPDAQPEIKELAEVMLKAFRASTPVRRVAGDLHLPFVTQAERDSVDLTDFETAQTWLKISSARCARVSYLNHLGKAPVAEEDRALFEKLVGGDIKHASPTEHPCRVGSYEDLDLNTEAFDSNFGFPWVQFRKYIPNEVVTKYEEFDDNQAFD